jgi:hypothetical protein
MLTINKLATVIGFTALSLSAVSAHADSVNLVVNGDFEDTTNGAGRMGDITNATGWVTTGYNFIFSPGTADTTGANSTQYGALTLWGPNNGGDTTSGILGNSPTGGNFVGADGAFEVGAITQTITGLVAGQQYSVGFDWAGAQQAGFTGNTSESWIVSLGSQSYSTTIANDISHGFTGWTHTTFTFTADGSSDVLSFLAAGTPDGEPPFSLLDGVSLTAVPEPASMTIMGSGLAALGFIRRRRAKK